MDLIQNFENCVQQKYKTILQEFTNKTFNEFKEQNKVLNIGISQIAFEILLQNNLENFYKILEAKNSSKVGDIVRFIGSIETILESDQAITAFQNEPSELNSKITVLKYLDNSNSTIPSLNTSQMLLEENRKYLVQCLNTDSCWVYNKMQITELKSKIVTSVYESEDSHLKINDVFGFIGIFRGFEEINDDFGGKDEYKNNNFTNENQNQSFIKIEIIYMKNLNELLLPCLKHYSIQNMGINLLEEVRSLSQSTPSLKEELFSYFNSYLFSDRLCTEYLLLSLISKLLNKGSFEPIGVLSVNYYGILNQEQGNLIINLISSVVDKVKVFKLTIEFLNSRNLIPSKNYSTNQIENNELQISNNTVIIIDEISLSEGKLNELGSKNIKYFENMIINQQMNIQFYNQFIKFPMNSPVICLSKDKSLFKSLIPIKLNISENIPMGKDLSEVILDQLRIYILLIGNENIVVELSPEMIDYAKSDFISNRKLYSQDSLDYITEEDFHGLLNISRLISKSNGRMKTEIDDYKHAKLLEIERKKRLLKSNKK